MLRSAVLSLLLAMSAGVPPPANAAQSITTGASGITRLEITRVESPTFAGRTVGNVGEYVKLVGRAYGEVDPRHAVITDLTLAPRNSSGMVPGRSRASAARYNRVTTEQRTGVRIC